MKKQERFVGEKDMWLWKRLGIRVPLLLAINLGYMVAQS